MKSSRGPTALLPYASLPRQGSEHLVGLCAVPRFFLLADASDASGRFSDNAIRGCEDTVPTHPRSHIVDNSVMICRASLVGYSISSRRPELVVLSPRSGIRFRAPQYGSIWSKCQAARRARDDVVQLVTIVAQRNGRP